MKCPANPECELVPNYTRGSYCKACSQFNEQQFMDNWHTIYFLVFSFIRRFNLRDFHASGKDPVMSMIASEIWLFSMERLLRENTDENLTRALSDIAKRERMLPKCNTHSLSLFLGIPNQTTRRKVNKLIEMGWVIKDTQGNLSISAACEETFNAEFNLETMRDFVSTARGTCALLGQSDPQP